MADQKLTALTTIPELSDDDYFYVVDDPAGTPVSRKATGEQMRQYITRPNMFHLVYGLS